MRIANCELTKVNPRPAPLRSRDYSPQSEIRNRPILVIAGLVERRHVDALDLREPRQRIGTAEAGASSVCPGAHDLDDRLFAFADEERVEEGVHRLRVEAGGAAREDQRHVIVPVGCAQRDAGQIERGQHVGVELLVGQA